MSHEIYNIKGVKYIVTPEIYSWQYIENIIKNIIIKHGYQEIKLPIIEKTFLFQRTLGKYSDIISKEMFTFNDKNKTSLTLRPEGTASCTKALINSGLIRNKQKQKYWYIGPMFRRENTQKGRQRQFHQVGIEAFGYKDHSIDVEQLLIINRIFSALNIKNIKLNINCLGTNRDIKYYKNILFNYFNKFKTDLNKLNKQRLIYNPIKLLDDITIQKKFNDIPILLDHINKDSKKQFLNTTELLKNLNIDVAINNYLVRGLDYYNDLVYEWTERYNTNNLTICAGGRYDNLSKQLHGEETYSTGCAIGLERLIALIKNKNIYNQTDIYIIFDNAVDIYNSFKISEQIRNVITNKIIISNHENEQINNKIKKAIKSQAKIIIIINNINLKNNTINIQNTIKKTKSTINLINIKNYMDNELC